MNAVAGTVRQLTRAANRAVTMTTEAAGAISGAAVNGVIGGVKGAASGAQRGVSRGSHSTPAAALTLGTLGVTGLVEWPIVAAVGGTALVVKQWNKRSKSAKASDVSQAPAVAPAKEPQKHKAAAQRPLAAVKSTAPKTATSKTATSKSATSSKTARSGPRRSPQAKKTTTRQPQGGASSRAGARH